MADWKMTASQLVQLRLAAHPEQLADLLAEAEAEAWQIVRGLLRDAMVTAILEALSSAPPAGETAPDSRKSADADGSPGAVESMRLSDPPCWPGHDNGHHLEARTEVAAPASPIPDANDGKPEMQAGPPDSQPAGVYVYGIVRRTEELDLPESGLEGPYPVRLQPYRNLAAVVSPVPLNEFGQEAIEANLADMAWLEAKVRGHQAVLDAILPQATLVPMKFATIYHSPAGVEGLLEENYDAFDVLLDRLRGRDEWGVKLYVAPAALSDHIAKLSPEVQRLQAEIAGKPQGAAYFAARKLRDLAEQETEQLSYEVADSTHDQLAALAHAAVLNPLQGPEITGPDETMVLNAAYLVDHAAQDEFRELLDRQARVWGNQGFRLELSGPWPAYNFVSGDIHA